MLKIGLIVASILSVIMGFVASAAPTETALQQLVNQNYLIQALLFSLFFLGLALLFKKDGIDSDSPHKE